MNGVASYYLRSSVLGGQVISELNASGSWTRGYVYLGLQLLAVQQNNTVTWVHQEPVTKGQRFAERACRQLIPLILPDLQVGVKWRGKE
jgi:hypothetical protein